MRADIDSYLEEAKLLLDRVDRTAAERAVLMLLDCHARAGRVWTIGNGGSASTAQHIACDLGKYAIPEGCPPFDARCLSDNIALYTAWANDAERDLVFVHQLRGLLRPSDLVILVSVHGGAGFSRDLVRAAEFARAQGAQTLCLVGFDGGPLHALATCSLLVPAHSTPHTEGLHLVVHHLLMQLVKERLHAAGARSRA